MRRIRIVSMRESLQGCGGPARPVLRRSRTGEAPSAGLRTKRPILPGTGRQAKLRGEAKPGGPVVSPRFLSFQGRDLPGEPVEAVEQLPVAYVLGGRRLAGKDQHAP